MKKLMYFIVLFGLCLNFCFSTPPKARRYSAVQSESATYDLIDSVNIYDAFFGNQELRHFPEPIENADYSTSFPDNELHIFAFNVGQANFILLRKGHQGVIIDAGGTLRGSGQISRLKDHIFKDIRIAAVFITHPHDDHYNMIAGLKTFYRTAFQNTVWYLAGNKDAWSTKIQNAINRTLTFLNYKELRRNNLIDGVEFHVFEMEDAQLNKDEHPNRNSPFIRVKYANKSILFTGDSEGEGIDRLKGEVNDFYQFRSMPNVDVDLIDRVYKRINKIVERYSKSDVSFYYDERIFGRLLQAYGTLVSRFYLPPTRDSMLRMFFQKYFPKLSKEQKPKLKDILGKNTDDRGELIDAFVNFAKRLSGDAAVNSFCDSINDLNESYNIANKLNKIIKYTPPTEQELFERSINTMIKRRIFEDSQLIFLPHHGTNTENSQRILGYFSGIEDDDCKRVFVISSSPFGKDHLPKRSTFEMAPDNNQQKEHLFVYQQDCNYLAGSCYFRMTKKPIYVTGAAPGGCYCFKIKNDDESLSLLDYEDGWIHVL